ncbi:GRIP and coiled-coil domain-containing protein 1-like isoform X1 [Ornithodoros turicata]|uniref:GRIP and coiled-coil domain-containing protein 1-like isoform X1 n=1 Tax=Ornithodoros turicata TaxID=34597 RepID=UPI003139C542
MTTITEHTNRRELCEIICAQQEKLKHYQTKLKDLVRGYKSLQKEKEALEASFKAISSQKKTNVPEDTQKVENKFGDTDKEESESSEKSQETQDAGHAEHSSIGCKDSQQVEALSEALVTLTEEKSRMEAAFQGDRRRLLQEKEVAIKQLNEQEQAASANVKALEAKLSELRMKLREEQTQREHEESNHAAMLRELQRLVAQERRTREALEEKLEAVTLRAAQADRVKEYEAKVQRLTLELTEVRRRLSDAEAKADEPSPLLLKVQQELVDLKVKHQQELECELERAAQAQAELKQQASGSETRVASLEGHLQELSQAVGTYDRLRLQDRVAIERLRERVSQLARENATLACSAGLGIGTGVDYAEGSEDSNLDVATLLDRFTKLRQTLKEANQRAENPVNLMAYFRELAEEEVLGLHAKCHEEQEQLKDEFERYKARAQSVIKNGSSLKGQESSREKEVLHRQVKELQGQVKSLRAHYEAEEQKNREKLTQLQPACGKSGGSPALRFPKAGLQRHAAKFKNAMTDATVAHRQEQCNLESTWRTKMAELESLMQGQRERTLALLEEKDRELHVLRAATLAPNHALSAMRNAGNRAERTADSGDSADPLLYELLAGQTSSKNGNTKAERQLLFYVQELARKDVEVAQALRAKHDAESALRDLQRVSLTRERRDAQELEILKLRLRQLEDSQHLGKGGSVNLQYLKNVVLQYLLCADSSSRRHMLNAIAAGLHFTSAEMDLVLQAAAAWW